jgi:hypothetical protein
VDDPSNHLLNKIDALSVKNVQKHEGAYLQFRNKGVEFVYCSSARECYTTELTSIGKPHCFTGSKNLIGPVHPHHHYE